MSARELLLALFLALGAGLIAWGVSMWSVPTALVCAGASVAAIGSLFCLEASD